jgi:hypothetical protein
MKTISLLTASLAACAGSAFAAPLAIEGRFGRVEVDAERPALSVLILRRVDGSLEPQSLLPPKGAAWLRGMPDWGTQALTFVVDEAGRRYESRNRAPEAVEATAAGLVLRKVMLTDGAGEPVAREDWSLESAGEELVWSVDRTWLRELTVSSAGTPALFFSTRPISGAPSTLLPNAVATTLWIAPEALQGWHNPHYRPAEWSAGYKLSRENNLVVTEPGGWAILKLFPAWQHESEPRLSVDGGHLYRRGHFGWLSEVGVVSQTAARHVFRAGDREQTTLRLAAVPAWRSGHQFQVQGEDATGTLATLRHFYGAVLNGGAVNDALHYTFGNETDGWYYGGASWMKGLPLLAGAAAADLTAARPHELPHAFRDNLQMILGTEYEPGLTRFGYNAAGAYTDDNIIQIIGGRAYYLYSGDLGFVRQHLPAYRRAVAWYLNKCNDAGLVSLTPVAHWYYDALYASGVTTYHNTFLYKALVDLSGLEAAVGDEAEAATHAATAATLKAAINRVLWWEQAPGGPRYVDWITPTGERIAYAADLCQFPPVALGIASPEQARQLIATLDARSVELERDHGYAGFASRSAYWPVPASVNTHPANQGFGNYMNGGSFLSMTYWEIMARAAAGDAEGAWRRLRRFAEGTRLTGERGFIGNNWVTPDGRIGTGACDEPYLSDMIAVPAALVQGILGIRHTNAGLEVTPVLPAGLPRVTAEVVHLGSRKRVSIDGTSVQIVDLGRAFTPPRELTWRVDAGYAAAVDLYIDRTFEAGGAWTATPSLTVRRGEGVLLTRRPSRPLVGLWKLDDPPGESVADGSEYGAVGRLSGPVVMQAPDRRGEPAAARFQGGAHITIASVEPYAFKPTESFTIQAWFQTSALENQVMVARPGAYSLGVKGGRISAWVMQDGVQYVEVLSAALVADGGWHHVAVVCDRAAQTLALFLDGKPDGAPLPIAHIGLSTSPVALTLGAFAADGGFPFTGALDEISIQRAALGPAGFSFGTDYARVPPLPLGALAGSYTTAPCDWGQPVRLTALRTTTALNDGAIRVRLETSNDGFATTAATAEIGLADGEQTVPVSTLPAARQTRLVALLATPETATRSPVLSAVLLSAEPAIP